MGVPGVDVNGDRSVVGVERVEGGIECERSTAGSPARCDCCIGSKYTPVPEKHKTRYCVHIAKKVNIVNL